MEPSIETRHHNHQGGHEMEMVSSMAEIEAKKTQTTTTKQVTD